MKSLMLIAASMIALGMGGPGPTRAANAANMGGNSGSNPPALSGTPHASQTSADLANDDIRQAQQQLQAEGLYKGPIDGALGETTKGAVAKYQDQNGLHITGSLDQATIRSLREDAGIAGSSSPPSGSEKPKELMTNPHPEVLGGSKPGGPTAPY